MLAVVGLWRLWQEQTPDSTGQQNNRAFSRYTANDSDSQSNVHCSQRGNDQNQRGAADANGKDSSQFSRIPRYRNVKRPTNRDNTILRHSKGQSHRTSQTSSNSNQLQRLNNILTNKNLTSRQRVADLEEIDDLSLEEIEEIYQTLENNRPPEGTSEAAWHWIVDELITAMRKNGADVSQMATRLKGIYENPSQDMIIRDYALQHLGHLRAEGGDPHIIGAALSNATHQKQGTLAGTALLAMQDRQGAEPLPSENSVTPLAIAQDSSYDIRSRITAMQVAGREGNRQVLPLAVQAAADSAQPTHLRMAAIATLADLGATEHQAMLQTLANGRDRRLRTAAKAALKKFTTSQP